MSKEIIESYLNQNPKDIAGLFNWMMMPGLDLSTLQVRDLAASDSRIYQAIQALAQKLKNLSSAASQDNISTELFYWMLRSGVETQKLKNQLIPEGLKNAFNESKLWADRVKNSQSQPFIKQENIDLITWMFRCNNLAGAFNWMMRSDVNIRKDKIPAVDQLKSSNFPTKYKDFFQETRDLAKKLKEGKLKAQDREACLQWMEKVKLTDLESFSSLSNGEKTSTEELFSNIKVEAVHAAAIADKNKDSLTLIKNPAAIVAEKNTTKVLPSILQQLKEDVITPEAIEEDLPMLQSILFNRECLLYLIQNDRQEFLGKAIGYYLAQGRVNQVSSTSNDFEKLAESLKGKTESIKENRKTLLNALIQLDQSRKFVAPLCVELAKTFTLANQIVSIASGLSPVWLLALCETPHNRTFLLSIIEKYAENANAAADFEKLITDLIVQFGKSPDDIKIVVDALLRIFTKKEKYAQFVESVQLADKYVRAQKDVIGAQSHVINILEKTKDTTLWNICLSLLSPENRVFILFTKLADVGISTATRATAEKALITVLKSLSENNTYTPEVLNLLSQKDNFYRLKNIYLESTHHESKDDIIDILKNRNLFFGLYKAFNGAPAQKNNWDFVVDTCLNLNALEANEVKQKPIISVLRLTENDRRYIKNSVADNNFEIEHAKKYPNYVADLKKQGFFSKLLGFQVPGQAERMNHYPKGSADILTPRITPEMAHYPMTTDTAGWSRLVAGTGSFGLNGMDPDVRKLLHDSDFFDKIQNRNGKRWDSRDDEILKTRRVLFNLYKELHTKNDVDNVLKWEAVLMYLGLNKKDFESIPEDIKVALQLTPNDFHYLKSEIKNNAFEIQYAKDYPASWKTPSERTWGEYLSWAWSGQSTRDKHYGKENALAKITPERSCYYAEIDKKGWDSFTEEAPVIIADIEESEYDAGNNMISRRSFVSVASKGTTVSDGTTLSRTNSAYLLTDIEDEDEDEKISLSSSNNEKYNSLSTTDPDSFKTSSITSRSTSDNSSIRSNQSTKSSSTPNDTFAKEVENILDFISDDRSASKPIFLNDDITVLADMSTYFMAVSALLEVSPVKAKENTLLLLMRLAFSNNLEDKETRDSIKETLDKYQLIPSLKTYLEDSNNREKLLTRYIKHRQDKEPVFSLEAVMPEAIKKRDAAAHHAKLSLNAQMTQGLGVAPHVEQSPIASLVVTSASNANNTQKSISSSNSSTALDKKTSVQIQNEYKSLYKRIKDEHQSGLALYNFIQTLNSAQKILLVKDLFKQESSDNKKPMTECFLCNLNMTEFLSVVEDVRSKENDEKEKLFNYLKDRSVKNIIPYDTHYIPTDKKEALLKDYQTDKKDTWISYKRTGAELVAVYKMLSTEKKVKSTWLSSSKTTIPSEREQFLEKLEATKKSVNGNEYMKKFLITMINEEEDTQRHFFAEQLTPKMIDAIGTVLATRAFFTVKNEISIVVSLLESIQKFATPENALSIQQSVETALANDRLKLEIYQAVCNEAENSSAQSIYKYA